MRIAKKKKKNKNGKHNEGLFRKKTPKIMLVYSYERKRKWGKNHKHSHFTTCNGALNIIRAKTGTEEWFKFQLCLIQRISLRVNLMLHTLLKWSSAYLQFHPSESITSMNWLVISFGRYFTAHFPICKWMCGTFANFIFFSFLFFSSLHFSFQHRKLVDPHDGRYCRRK